MVVFESLTLLVRFLLEMCMLAALAYWGFKTGDSAATQVLLGVGVPVLVGVVWGLFISPKATVEVSKPVWVGLQVIVFGAAAVALAAVAQQLAVLFAVAVVLHGAAMAVLAVRA